MGVYRAVGGYRLSFQKPQIQTGPLPGHHPTEHLLHCRSRERFFRAHKVLQATARGLDQNPSVGVLR